MRKHLPDALTLANLFCGCCAVVLWLADQPYAAAAFTAASFILDYADGWVARALGASSPLGRELDSLADVVSFGAVPGIVFYRLLADAWCANPALLWCWPATPAFVLTVFAAYRLARFNLDLTPRTYFVGLSTPACTLLVLGLALAAHNNDFGLGMFFRHQPWAIYALTALLSYLMVSRVPMHGLKIRPGDPKGWWRVGAFVAVGAVLLGGLGPLGLTAVVVGYMGYSLVQNPAREVV